MNVIPLGPLMLNFGLVTFLLSALVGYLALRYRLSKVRSEGISSDKFATAIILGFLIWKFSLIIFDPGSVIEYPMSLLYYNGGDRGLWLAIVILIVYLGMRVRKEGSSIRMNLDVMIVGLLAGSGTYNLMLLILDSTNKLLHSLYICLMVIVLILIFTNKISIVMMRKNGLTIIAVLILVVWGVYDSFRDHIESNNLLQIMAEMNVGIKKGNIAPNFELKNVNEQPVMLSSFKGQKVILNFWATWCPPCRVEMPQMEKFHNDYEKDVVVLAINLTHTEKNQSAVRAFVEDSGLTFPVVMDAEGDVTETYQIIAYPTSYIIDSNGIIQEVFEGAINYETMKKAISKIN